MTKEIRDSIHLQMTRLSDVLITVSWLKEYGLSREIVTQKQVKTLEDNIKECITILSKVIEKDRSL